MREFGRDRGNRGGRDRGGGGGYGRGGGGGGGYDRGGSGGGGGSYEKPVKEGEEYEVTIEAVGAKGDGICKINNFVVFVPGAQAGERLRVRIDRVLNRFALASSTGSAGSSSGGAPQESSGESQGSTEASTEETGGEESGETEQGQ